jgi:glycine/D-amino acid oxidase-like deaminating enzyme
VRVLDPEPAAQDIARARANLEAAFPAFKGIPTVATWAGIIDCTPDILPVISKIDSLPGLVISTGYSGHGFGIGPGAGHLTVDLVTGEKPIVDPAPFRFSRLSDGSDLKALAGL